MNSNPTIWMSHLKPGGTKKDKVEAKAVEKINSVKGKTAYVIKDKLPKACWKLYCKECDTKFVCTDIFSELCPKCRVELNKSK